MANHIVPADELVTIFTSGTTAQAKAVVHTHGSVLRKTHPTRYLPGVPQGRGPTFVGMPFFWVGGLSILGRALQAGSTLVCQEKFDLESAVALMEEEHVAEVIAWPTTIARLRSHPRVRRGSLASVAALAPPSIERELTHNSLGMTETMGPHTGGPRPDAPPEETIVPLPERLRGSWGAPLEGMQHRVVDLEGGETISDDTIGEICVRGSSMMMRLYKKERFETFDADGWYHTGDEGSLRDGYLFFKGRIGDMIKVRGANVAPREVEVALEKAADVSTAVVVGLPDPMEGEQVAALITAKSADVDLVQVREALRSQLSPYKIPSTIVVWPDELPTLPSGKPDRKTVRQILSES
jgi:acyl-CoA synthetase (AMP-forming)/AMP-acid ligase II